MLSTSGCSSSDANSAVHSGDRSQLARAGDAGIVPQEPVPDTYRPVDADNQPLAFSDTTYSDGSPTHYADGSPAYMPDGTPVDYRPRNIMQAIDRLDVLYIRDDGQTPLGFEGPASRPLLTYLSAEEEHQVKFAGELPNPRLDPATGRVCWWAFECRNPDCSGQHDGKPFMFAAGVPGVTVDGSEDDAALLEQVDAEGLSSFDLMKCPKCNERDSLERAVLSNTARRTAEFQSELERVRGE